MKKSWLIGIFALLAVAVLVLAPAVGTSPTPLRCILHPNPSEIESYIFWSIRLPRVLCSFLAGAGLAVSGMAFQAMFRNPLATESTPGVAGGASVGAALYVRLGLALTVCGISGISVFAFVGALFSIALVYGLANMKRDFSTSDILLSGVAIGFFFSGLILLIQSVSDFHDSFKLLHWMIGGLGSVGYDSALSLLPFVLIGSACVTYLSRELNLLMLGDELALSRGVNVQWIRLALFVTISLTVGGIVAVSGPIGFIGMIVPHICRLFVGTDHRVLAPSAMLLGGAFLTICDTVARLIISPAEMPVGAITALLGGPFFVWLLASGAGKGLYGRSRY